MDNQRNLIVLAVAVIVAAVAAGVVLRGTTKTPPPTPTPIAAATPATPAEKPTPKPATARPIPDRATPAAYTTTASGLQYADLVVGTGPEAAKGQRVKVEYTGWLDDESHKMFDSSFKRNDPFAFVLGAGQVIAGWDEGVAGMKVGGKRQLKIPGNLAYGEMGRPGRIPPNATLIFDIELVAIPPERKPPEFPGKIADKQLTKTASGLQYRDLVVGTGAQPQPTSEVQVEYTGWLLDGTLFDSSYKRDESIKFPLNQVIAGWTEGVGGMKVGGKRQLVIPAELAYGKRGKGQIPPDATLMFEVELLDITRP